MLPPLLVASLISVLVLLALIGALWLLRRRKARREHAPARNTPNPSAQRVRLRTEAPRGGKRLDSTETRELLDNARSLARDNPEKVAQIMRGWLDPKK